MNGRKSSPWVVGLAIAALAAVLLVGYAGLYWLRLPYGKLDELTVKTIFVGREPDTLGLEFPTTVETRFFRPAVLIHQWLHVESLGSRMHHDNPYYHP